MFENFRGIEYGWGSGSSFINAITRSYIALLMYDLWTVDRDDPKLGNWWVESLKLVCENLPGPARLGTPMDHGAEALEKWIERIRQYERVMSYLYPLGFHGRATMLRGKDKRSSKLLHGPDLLWKINSSYQTEIFTVEDQRLNLSDMDRLLGLLIKATGDKNFDKASPELKADLTEQVEQLERNRSLITVAPLGWLPRSQHPEQLEATEYQDECNRYQASEAGRKAKRLLLENLTPIQEEDYFRYGHFFVVPRSQEEVPLHERRLYVIERSFPNGNILRVKQEMTLNKRHFKWFPEKTYCFHTKDPHAIDDILLAQKLVLENDENEFLKQANESNPAFDGRFSLEVSKRSV